MATPRHRLIADAMVTRFGALTTAGGYNTNVRKAVRSAGVTWTMVPPADRPWIGVIAQEERLKEEPGCYRIEADYDVVGLLTAATEAAKYTAIAGLRSDIRKAINTDTGRWGLNPDVATDWNAVGTKISTIKTDDIDDPKQGAIIIRLTVIYYERPDE